LEHILEPDIRPHILNDPHMAVPQWTWQQDALPEYLWDVVLFSDDSIPSEHAVRISYSLGCCHIGVDEHKLTADPETQMANTAPRHHQDDQQATPLQTCFDWDQQHANSSSQQSAWQYKHLQETQAITVTQTLTDQRQHGPSPSSKLDIRQREGQRKPLRVTPLQTPADRKQQQRRADHVNKQRELQRRQWQESQATTVTQTLTDADRTRQKQEPKDEASDTTTPIETPGGCKQECAQPMVALMFIGSPHHCCFSPLPLAGDWDLKALCAVAAPASYLSHGQPCPLSKSPRALLSECA
jgi:hypothetical protein